MKYAGISYDRWVNFPVMCYFLRLLGMFCGHLVYLFSPFWHIVPRKSGNSDSILPR
jgi:hypothetical protein